MTEVDEACEELIVGGIQAKRPGDSILAEEGSGEERRRLRPGAGSSTRSTARPTTRTAIPRFCVSIGVERDGAPFVGVIYDPLLDEMFTAVRGQGARLNDVPIHVSTESKLDQALLCTGFAYDVQRSPEDNVAEFVRFLKASRAVRRDGSAALDLGYVAAGRFDGFWEFKLKPWDVAAGCLIVEEAGGRTSDAKGGESHREGRSVVASNSRLHEAMLSILKGNG